MQSCVRGRAAKQAAASSVCCFLYRVCHPAPPDPGVLSAHDLWADASPPSHASELWLIPSEQCCVAHSDWNGLRAFIVGSPFESPVCLCMQNLNESLFAGLIYIGIVSNVTGPRNSLGSWATRVMHRGPASIWFRKHPASAPILSSSTV